MTSCKANSLPAQIYKHMSPCDIWHGATGVPSSGHRGLHFLQLYRDLGANHGPQGICQYQILGRFTGRCWGQWLSQLWCGGGGQHDALLRPLEENEWKGWPSESMVNPGKEKWKQEQRQQSFELNGTTEIWFLPAWREGWGHVYVFTFWESTLLHSSGWPWTWTLLALNS